MDSGLEPAGTGKGGGCGVQDDIYNQSWKKLSYEIRSDLWHGLYESGLALVGTGVGWVWIMRFVFPVGQDKN